LKRKGPTALSLEQHSATLRGATAGSFSVQEQAARTARLPITLLHRDKGKNLASLAISMGLCTENAAH
jgi:hypothetical protein